MNILPFLFSVVSFFVACYIKLSIILQSVLYILIYINTIIHFIKTILQYNWHNNKNTDGLVNRLASSLAILNQAHRVAWLIGQEKTVKKLGEFLC